MDVFDARYLRGTIRLTSGRIAWVGRATETRILPHEEPALGPITRETSAVAQHAYDLGMTRRRAKESLYGAVSKEKNSALDDVTSGVFNQLELLARIHVAGTEMGDRVRRLAAAFYPRNLKPMTNGPFPEELEAARRTVRLARGELAAEVAAIPGFASLIELLEERADDFEAVLEREKVTGPSFDEAAAVADEAERRVADLVNAIQVLYQGDSAEAAARRAELLEPYAIQQESMRRRFRRRQRPVDVDPDTGEELVDGEAEPAEPVLEPA